MNILYATDGSDSSGTAGRLLASLPLPTDAQVTVLSTGSSDEWVESMIFTETSAQEVRLAWRHAEKAATLLDHCGLRICHEIGSGDAVTAILERAEMDHADLIVISSHEKRAIERFLIGSVSEHVARFAHTSVLVARKDQIRRVVVGVDGSASSEHALDALTELPLPAGIAVTFVYVAPLDDKELPSSVAFYPEYAKLAKDYRAERRAVAEHIVDHARQRLRAAGHRAEVDIRWGTPADQLIGAVRELGADLLVVGSANRSVMGRLFVGSVSGRVLSHAPCSVLVARPVGIPAIKTLPASEVAGAGV
jgi:nucleotide-binding universal stress UspA family protein